MISETAEKKAVLTADDSDIEIREIKGRKELKKFISFAYELYKGTPAYVPELQFDELDNLDENKTPPLKPARQSFTWRT